MVQRYSGLLSLFANYFQTKYLPFLFLLFALAFIQSYVSAFLNHIVITPAALAVSTQVLLGTACGSTGRSAFAMSSLSIAGAETLTW